MKPETLIIAIIVVSLIAAWTIYLVRHERKLETDPARLDRRIAADEARAKRRERRKARRLVQVLRSTR